MMTITTSRGKVFTVTTLTEQPACSYERGSARWTYGPMLLARWEQYRSDAYAIGIVKRLAKKLVGWPVDVEWFVFNGELFYKR